MECPSLDENTSKKQKIKVVERKRKSLLLSKGDEKQCEVSECEPDVSKTSEYQEGRVNSLMTRNEQTRSISQKVLCLHFLVLIKDKEWTLNLEEEGNAVSKNAHETASLLLEVTRRK
ncbi:hypothetical protein GOODEAATRI_021563 [Goodea atripinnis]|uniref:Uncharacterized protein n=1 Tax=Goodea atripinnis TaxID=208336 RepID=A0ABV0NM75_9TELE